MMMRSVGQKLFSTASRRSMSTQQQFAPFQGMYSTFFRSNLSYVTFVIVGAMAFEGVYGTFGDMVWEMNNRGRLFHHIDWTQFKTDDDEDEEDDE